MPEVWEQEGHLRARPCFRGDIEEELNEAMPIGSIPPRPEPLPQTRLERMGR
jgi:hypothetical protein